MCQADSIFCGCHNDDVQQLMGIYDSNYNGQIDFDEFKNLT